MLESDQLMPFNFLNYGGKLSGEHHGMRYMLFKQGEKESLCLEAAVWPEPFCLDKTADDKIITASFEFSEAGREQAIEWMKEQYRIKRTVWNNTPGILDAVPHK